ncbi:hypothetical protein Dimus_039213 [Dionaea muscipula]
MPICVDNQSAIAIARNPVYHDRSKHIDIHFHFLREAIVNKEVELIYVRTQAQPADVLRATLVGTFSTCYSYILAASCKKITPTQAILPIANFGNVKLTAKYGIKNAITIIFLGSKSLLAAKLFLLSIITFFISSLHHHLLHLFDAKSFLLGIRYSFISVFVELRFQFHFLKFCSF